MCLYTNEEKPVTATEDIVCYKVTRREKDEEMVSLYMYSPIKMNQVMTAPKFQTEPRYYGKIEYGFHSFAELDAALYEMADRIVARHEEFFVIECRIPKGSRFWTGEFSRAKSYVSNKIEYVKIIEGTGLFDFFNIQETDEGKSFVCMWNEEKVEGKIHFEDGEIFLCQNSLNGRDAVNKLGYNYSWVIITSSDAEDIKDFKIVG
jgi:hypothetical protein